MQWAAEYLSLAVTPSGRFVYRQDRTGENDSNQRYNILRHAGTLYALAQYYSQMPPDEFATRAMKRAANYLMDCCIGPVPGQSDMLAVWSRPELIGRPQRPLQAKLGGTGLSLAALIQLEQALPGTTPAAILKQLGDFLLFMQKRDGSFYSKYFPEGNARDDQWTSLYYPGEAALGLIMLFEFNANSRWLVAAIDTLRYLARSRESLSSPPADHWALIATARLFDQNREALQRAAPFGLPWVEPHNPNGTRLFLLEHAEAVVKGILNEQIQDNTEACLNGGFNLQGRLAPTATRLEGLLASLPIIKEGSLRKRTRKAVELGMGYLAAAQIRTGPTKGGFTRHNPNCNAPAARANEIRIDYVQHALAAMFLYHFSSNRVLAPYSCPGMDAQPSLSWRSKGLLASPK